MYSFRSRFRHQLHENKPNCAPQAHLDSVSVSVRHHKIDCKVLTTTAATHLLHVDADKASIPRCGNPPQSQ